MNAPVTSTALVPAVHPDRRTYIGGSDIAAVMGLSPWRTPLELYLEKIADAPPTISEEKRRFFARRKRQEPVVAEMLHDTYGIEVTRLSMDGNPNRYIDPSHPFLAAEIDFEFGMSDAARAAFPERADWAAVPDGTLLNGEIKTVHPFMAKHWGEQGSEEVPVYYAAQTMFGLGVTRRPAALIAALFGIDNLVGFPVMSDGETIGGMRGKAVAFWNNHVLARVPPEPYNMDDMMILFAKANGRPVEADETLLAKLTELKNVRGSLAAYKRDEEQLVFEIADAIRIQWGLPVELEGQKIDNAIIRAGGIELASWKSQSRTTIDSKRLQAERPEIAREYSNTSHFRVLRFKKGA